MLIILIVISFNNLNEMSKRTQDVRHTYEVRLKNSELIKTLISIETGQRGFLLTKDESFLENYKKGRPRLNKLHIELRALVSESKAQVGRLDTINMLLQKRINAIDVNIKNVQSGKEIDSHQLYLGKLYMDKLREITTKFEEKELKNHQQRFEIQAQTDKRMRYYLLGLSGLSCIFFIIFFRLLYVEFSQRIRFQNILENKLNQLEHTNTELEQFAYIASHDLQEPLRKIRSFAERLSKKNSDQLDEEGKVNLLKISTSANRMQHLINDLLMFSRASNTNDFVVNDVDLNEVLSEIEDEFSELIIQKQAIIYHSKLPKITGIRTQLLQLFSNIISNSLKYSVAGKPVLIDIRYKKVNGSEIPNAGDFQKESVYHRITFIDNGIGFEKQYAEKIFTIFQRLHNKNEFEGTGIGLALCRRIVTNHSGFMMAEVNEKRQGAIFHVYLPK